MERSFSQARLNALRMQLDPHFLFNALNTVSSQVERDPRLARRMIEHLGDLLRLSLEARDRQEVPLAEEMAFLDHYVAIQRIRFGSTLRIETHIAPEVKYALVPCLIVQPLVENAIRHGISRRASGGAVTVTAERSAEQVQIRIIDDGVGLPPGWTLENSTGLGLSVTRERIAGIHPNGSSRFAVGRRSGGGTEVEISLPLRLTGELANDRPPHAKGIRVLVADDEAPARQRLIDLLDKDAQVEAVMEAGDGQAAVDTIKREAPDLVFLDVQMPQLDGMDVVKAVGADAMPLTVFVTAYDQHAIKAFEANALDYLLKPFSDERLEAALCRAKARHDERNLHQFGRNVRA